MLVGDAVDEAEGGGVRVDEGERDDEGETVADGEDDADAELDPVAVSVEEGVEEYVACVAVRDGVGLEERVAEAVRDTLAVTVADAVVVDDAVALVVDVACAVNVIEAVIEGVADAVRLAVAEGVTSKAMSMPCTVSARTLPAAASQDG